MQTILYKKHIFNIFFKKIFGHIKKKHYLCTRFEKKTKQQNLIITI